VHPLAQALERGEHFLISKIRVPPARVRQHEHSRALEALGLQPERDCLAGPQGKDESEEGDADKRHDFRSHAPHFSPERAHAGDVFLGAKCADARGWARNQVGDPESPLRQPAILFVADRLGDEPRLVQELPEAIRVSREVMACRGGSDAGVDADKQDADRAADAVGERR